MTATSVDRTESAATAAERSTRPEHEAPGAGFVTTALADVIARLSNAVFYVAGPPPMTDATLALLRDNGIQLDRVHYDSFG